MRYLIIGLGIYGSNLAIDLTNMGHEVIGADKDPSLVESIKDYISTAYIIDSTDEMALSVLPLKTVDLVIVAIGENFGASIRTVAILKKLEVKHIYARAIDKLHESILEGFNLDRIITPEQRAANDLVNEITLGNDTTAMRVDEDNLIATFPVPAILVGLNYSTLQLEKDYGLKLLCASRPTSRRNLIGVRHEAYALIPDLTDPNLEVAETDRITCLGSKSPFNRLINKS